MLRNKLLLIIILILIATILPVTRAEVKLPSVFSDKMVLQRNSEITILGWAFPLEEVTIVTAWDDSVQNTITCNDATWSNTAEPAFFNTEDLTASCFISVLKISYK
jgi:sialate O-acetylesterase